eukprot:351865-Chlamydomonas_euryale.AAC.4
MCRQSSSTPVYEGERLRLTVPQTCAGKAAPHLSRKVSGCASQCRRHRSASWYAGTHTPPNAPAFKNVQRSKWIMKRRRAGAPSGVQLSTPVSRSAQSTGRGGGV